MLPAFLITFREVIEASLIVATILGILYKLNHRKSIRTVWYATGTAVVISSALLLGGSLLGIKIQEIYTGHVEELVEGTFMVISAIFITWAVFFLHSYFGKYKVQLLQKVKKTLEAQEQNGIFLLAFTAVFREGFEIVLFLSTIYLSSDPGHIFTGFVSGILAGLVVSYLFFNATLNMPVYYTFRVTSALLILFAAGLLTRGVHEFAEAGYLPELGEVIIRIIPEKGTFVGDMIKAVFGITQSMDYMQIGLYLLYAAVMIWYVFFRKTAKKQT